MSCVGGLGACRVASLKDTSASREGKSEINSRKKPLLSPLSQNPRASTRWERVGFEPEPAVDLDVDQRGCIVFPESVGTEQVSRTQVL